MGYGIDITENAVRVVKSTAKGVITRSGEAEFYTEHEPGTKEYVADLAYAIKMACRIARVSGGIGTSCAVVAGGPEVVVRRFTWPEMPPLALQENARMEFAPFLPGEASEFSIGFEMVKRHVSEETSAVNVDVIVAALPKTMVDAIDQAVRKAGLRASRIDVRENSRIHLIDRCCIVDEGSAPESYAILDFSQNRANLGLYLNGVFYSNRYFVATTPIEEGEDPSYDPYAQFDEPEEGEEPKEKVVSYRYDPVTLANEIVSIIDYMRYRERDASLECIFLIGEDQVPGIEDSLEDSLDIPVFTTYQWLINGITGRKCGQASFHIAPYLDAYGASLPRTNPKQCLHLAGSIKPSVLKKTVLPLLIPGIAVAAIVGVTIAIMTPQVNRLERELAEIEDHMARHPVTLAEFNEMQQRVNMSTTQINNIVEFYTEWPHAHDIMPFFFSNTVEGRLQRHLTLLGFSIEGGEGNITGNAIDFVHLADAVDAILSHQWIHSAIIDGAADPSREDFNFANVEFDIPIELERGVGLAND